MEIQWNIETTCEFTQKLLVAVYESYSKQVKKYWKDILYNIDDKIWWFTKNIITHWLSKKQVYNILDIFEFMKKIIVFVKLQLLQYINKHNFILVT